MTLDERDDSHTRWPGWRGPIRPTVKGVRILGEPGDADEARLPLPEVQPEPPIDLGACRYCGTQMEGVTTHQRKCPQAPWHRR